MSRLYSHSDDDEVLSGRKEPLPPTDLNEYRQRSVDLVKAEIDKVIEGHHCPQCRSRYIRDHAQPAARGATWRFKYCDDCGHVWDAGLDT